jgi:F0F1-type ATP synthase assembly protein I
VAVGSAIAGLIAGGTVLGWFVDSRAGTSPVFVLLGLALGMVAASSYAYVKFRSFMKD